jgi:hypothetical protein
VRVELSKTFRFEAAHRLPNVPADHKCYRMHGHSFAVDVVLEGELDERMGWLVDYADITAVVEADPPRRARSPRAQTTFQDWTIPLPSGFASGCGKDSRRTSPS